MKFLFALLLTTSAAHAEAPMVTAFAATQTGVNWRFDVSVTHADSGWEHYADGWRIEADDGRILGTRVLAHPHVSEQPFTRSLSGVAVATETTVYIRTKCLVDGWSDERYQVVLD